MSWPIVCASFDSERIWVQEAHASDRAAAAAIAAAAAARRESLHFEAEQRGAGLLLNAHLELALHVSLVQILQNVFDCANVGVLAFECLCQAIVESHAFVKIQSHR